MSGLIVIFFVFTIFSGCIGSLQATEEDGGGILLNRLIKTPWDEDNLSPDDIRCYCNLPLCITTGYMCRTARTSFGGCFSEIRESSDKLPTRHGCMELLKDNDKHMQCDNLPRSSSSSSNSISINSNSSRNVKPLSTIPPAVMTNNNNRNSENFSNSNSNSEILLLCCQDDMCNHVDNPDNTKRSKPNLTIEGGEGETIIPVGGSNPHPLDDIETRLSVSPSIPSAAAGYDNDDFWFKVATIAVPIFGAVILVFLIALAIRILRTDSLESPSKLGGVIIGSGGGNRNGGCSTAGGRKIPIDYDAYGGQNHHHNIKHVAVPLLKHDTNLVFTPNHHHHHHHHHHHNNVTMMNGGTTSSSNGGNIITSSDRKNETQAKINQLMNLEYSLLPQSCNDPNIKPQNNEIICGAGVGGGGGSGGGVGGIGSGDVGGNICPLYRNVNLSLPSNNRCKENSDKIYEKDTINPVTANWAGSGCTSYGM